MRKMQEIQPEVKAIQDRYAKLKATDPAKQKMNQELMALYKERGVNPASGCVPMLLTLPVLFAFYALLSTAIELRGAPFVGWIHDLSRARSVLRHAGADGRHAVLAAADDAGGRRRSGAAEDDDVHAGRVHVHVPLGCRRASLIYWLVSNVWRIGQQYADELHDRSAERPHACGRPAERRVKRVGGGKTDAAARRRELSYEPTPTQHRSSISSNAFVAALGIDAHGRRRRDAPTARGSTSTAKRPSCSCAIAASRSRRCSTSSTWRSAATLRRRAARVRRRAGLSQGQGHRAAADGEVPRREGEADRRRSAARPAESVRAPARAPGRRRSPGRRRPRASATRSRRPFSSRCASSDSWLATARLESPSRRVVESRCSPPPTPSSRSRRRRAAAASASCA